MFVGPDCSTSSVDASNSHVHMCDKLNVRAMPDPDGLSSSERQHDQQSIAQTLRLEGRVEEWLYIKNRVGNTNIWAHNVFINCFTSSKQKE